MVQEVVVLTSELHYWHIGVRQRIQHTGFGEPLTGQIT
jgi:hypothetical protein